MVTTLTNAGTESEQKRALKIPINRCVFIVENVVTLLTIAGLRTIGDRSGGLNSLVKLTLRNLTFQDPSRLGYLKTSNLILQEHRKKNQKGKWYLDSACSRHMTGDKQLFKTVTKLDGGTVTFGDKSKGNIIGIGNVPLSSTCEVDEVYLVDELGYNLLSSSQLCENDYEVRFKKYSWFIEDKSGKVILSGNRDKNVYTISNIDSLENQICLASVIDNPWVWHRKLGHASMSNVKRDTTFLLSEVITEENLKAEPLKTFAMTKESLTISLHQDRLNRMECKKPNIGYFHPFGCKCFIHNNGKDNLGKFDPKSDEGIFLGYSPSSRAYRVYNKRTLCIEESIHVIFVDTNPHLGNKKLPEDEEISIVPKSTFTGIDCQEESTGQQDQSTEEHNEVQESSSTEQLTTEKRETTTTIPNEWKSEIGYPHKFIIGNPHEGITTRKSQKLNSHMALISQLEPNKVNEALKDVRWVKAMKDELDQFERNKVWKLVPKPSNTSIVGTKWVYRNKLNESGLVMRNKTRLVAQGYSQQEGID
ncbi:uncharacterized protein LOC142180148 [Nicotiana tabacum]|uniref:Uncharacterized protein LOC142180148 n=1 Tax=Nicotiana tabacum TaxID=4097 RepID=A0AC58UCG8_TOBAC